ncbi:hypothetical protein MTR67_017752 [Solanum verrucosum]|uniref:Uncharacterized protein n=1 Tax=Solanum verrucosum TaxID=315347 RepID=A0AAF0TL17_SOLVR|nr:hypothetical protein MTR67_017752 [Solanum verrucosum]
MRNGNRAEEHSGLSTSVKMPDDIVMKIISRCPLKSDGSALALDTKKEEGILIDSPKFIDHYVLSTGKILTSRDMSGSDIWLGMAQGLLTLLNGSIDKVFKAWRRTVDKAKVCAMAPRPDSKVACEDQGLEGRAWGFINAF